MKKNGTSLRRIATVGLAGTASLFLTAAVSAAPIEKTWIGTWDSTGSGNPTGSGGPGISVGQRYVIKAVYDDTSTTSSAPVLTGAFAPSGQQMTTIDLTDSGNSLGIFVPMEGLDTGTPFIYQQNESDHFPAFIPAPTLNFAHGSDISNSGNIIGLEFEGNFVGGAGNNIIELFNTTPDGVSPINMVSTALNFGVGPSATDTNGLLDAVPVQANDSTVTYSAGDLTKSTALTVQSNDLGAGRSDGETFLSSAWSVAGAGQANGVDIAVAIADSGLTNTADSTAWSTTVTEQMTGLSDGASVIVDYANASPTANLSAVGDATGVDFSVIFTDLDLAVNALIAGFEAVAAVGALVDGAVTSFFNDLLANEFQNATHAALESAFGLGSHTLTLLLEDLSGATGTATATFLVESTEPPPVPLPSTLLLLWLGIALLGWNRAAHRR